MNILQVCDIFSPKTNGTRVLVHQLLKALQERGHNVTLCCNDLNLDQSYIDSFQGVTILPFHVKSDLMGFPMMPSMIKWTRENLNKFDVIHQHSYRNFANIVIHRYSTEYHVPYVLDCHGSFSRLGKAGLKVIFDTFVGNAVVRDSKRIVAETVANVNEYEKAGIPSGKIVLLPPPPCDVEEFDHLPDKGIFRQKFNLDGKRVIMSLGRINWIKGLDFLVETFSEMLKERSDITLVIVGNDDGYKRTLEGLIDKLGVKDKVLFAGYLGGQDKLEALRDADVVVQPSRYESGVGAPVEAILCGTPIIVSQNTGSSEDVKRMDGGYLFEFGDITDLRNQIDFVFTHPQESWGKILNGQAYVHKHLSMKRKVLEYEELYRACIEEKKCS